MNKIKWMIVVLAVCLVGFFPSQANAQQAEPQAQNRIKVAYGDGIYNTAAIGILQAMIGGGLLNDVTDASTAGTFSLGYRRVTDNGRWALGGDASYFHISTSGKTSANYDFGMVMASADCYYKPKGIFRVYGTAGAGVMFASGDAGFAFQVNPVAIRVGNDNIAAFAEVGVGIKGVFNLGLEFGF